MLENNSTKNWTLGWLEPSLSLPHTELRTLNHQLFRGGRSSPYRFAERDLEYQRAYQPGDPIKAIDWRAKARTNKLFVRQATQNQQSHFNFVIDCSENMQFPQLPNESLDASDQDVSKFEFALRGALHIAHSALKHGDIVNIFLLTPSEYAKRSDYDCFQIAVPTPQKLQRLWSLLQAVPPTSWPQTLIEFGKPSRFKNTRNEQTIFFSDLLSFGQYCAEHVFLNHNSNLIFIHCLHSLERNPEYLPESLLFELKDPSNTLHKTYLKKDLLSESKLSQIRDRWVDTLRKTSRQHSYCFIEASENTAISDIYSQISEFTGEA